MERNEILRCDEDEADVVDDEVEDDVEDRRISREAHHHERNGGS